MQLTCTKIVAYFVRWLGSVLYEMSKHHLNHVIFACAWCRWDAETTASKSSIMIAILKIS